MGIGVQSCLEMKDRLPGLIFSVLAIGTPLAENACAAPNLPERSQTTLPTQTPLETYIVSTPVPRETPPPGWKEYVIEKMYGRVSLKLQLPDEFEINKDRQQDQETIFESKPTRDLSQMVRIRIIRQLTTFEADTFSEQIADMQGVLNKDERSTLKLNVEGKDIMSFVKRNETANQGVGIEHHIFGLTYSGVGIAIIIDVPSNRLRDEKGNFQRVLDRIEPISGSSQK